MRKTLFFDFGNVLIYFDKQKLYEQLAATLNITVNTLKKKLAETNWEKEYELGNISSIDLYHKVKQFTCQEVSFTQVSQAITNIFSPNQEILPILRRLKTLKHQLIILSNTQELHYSFAFINYPHFHYFDKKVLSYEVGYRKPDPRIYYKALDIAACRKENAFFIDDLEENIQGASSIGLQGSRFDTASKLENILMLKGYLSPPPQKKCK